MAKMLADFKDRDEAHQHLAGILSADPKSKAECREDNNAEKPFQVWSDATKPEPDDQPTLSGVIPTA